MALSNYILQSIIAIVIFYGIGFGYAGILELWESILIAILIFSGQIMLSYYWLKHFKYGPLEWLWRRMTYGKLIKGKKEIIPN